MAWAIAPLTSQTNLFKPASAASSLHIGLSARCSFLASFLVATSTYRPSVAVMASAKYDSHLHVWAPAEEADRYPFAGQMLGATSNLPPIPGYAELLNQQMQEADISGALIVQPTNHLYDHSYLNTVLQRYPGKFIGCLLADPTPGGGGPAAIRQLAKEHGYRAVRFNPYLWPEGEKMTNEVGQAMYKTAGELGLPVGHMAFKGLLLHIDEIEQLLQLYPQTKAILDHMGFCKADNMQSEEWRRLLALAEYPQVYVKASAFFRVSSEAYPYKDACQAVRVLVDTFGAERIMWGTDWPWVIEKHTYGQAWTLLDQYEEAVGRQLLTENEQEWVFGKTLSNLFPGAFRDTTTADDITENGGARAAT